MKRLLRYVTLALWGAVLVGIVYYFVVVYRAPQAEPAHAHVTPQTGWRDVPIAEVGAGEEYEELEQYGTLYVLEYLLDYDSIWTLDELQQGRSFGLYDEEEDDDENEVVEVVEVKQTKSTDTPQASAEQSQEQSTRIQGVISDWDHLFQKYGNKYGWDWFVLASIAYQESKFRAEVVGMGGATAVRMSSMRVDWLRTRA